MVLALSFFLPFFPIKTNENVLYRVDEEIADSNNAEDAWSGCGIKSKIQLRADLFKSKSLN